MRETEKTETEREIVVNMDHMSMLEFGHFLFLFLTCRFFPFFALGEFIDYCKHYLTMYLTGLDRMGARLTRLTWGIYLHTLLLGTFFKVGRRAGQLDSGIKTSFFTLESQFFTNASARGICLF